MEAVVVMNGCLAYLAFMQERCVTEINVLHLINRNHIFVLTRKQVVLVT